MPAPIMDEVLKKPLAEFLLPGEAVWQAADVRVRVWLAAKGFETARFFMNDAQGQLWERLAEWGEQQ